MVNILKKLNLWPDKIDIKALGISFLIINFAYLYHSLNFMWGNHDVVFIKERLFLSSGLFEGRFSQFIPQVLLTNGQILPLLNNLLGFTFLTIALWLLAKYWNIPKSLLNYVLFISFFATLPFTLSWLYFTFITMSCLFWTMLIILGLYLSALIYDQKQKIILSLIATLCFYLSFGGYPPVINTIFIGLSAHCLINYTFKQKSLRILINMHKFTLLNIVFAAFLFKLTLFFVAPNDVYNLELINITDIPNKFVSTLTICYKQFFISLPFMSQTYKFILLALVIFAFIVTLLKGFSKKRGLLTLFLFLTTVWFSSLTTFLVVPHTEYVARIDFFGLGFIYNFALALLLFCTTPIIKSITIMLMIILIPYNILNDYHAQKIWQQGFKAEMKILEDVAERIENHPNFNPARKYRFYQAGDISLRPSYYRQKFDKDEPFLLSLPYLAIWQGAPLIEFYSPFNYIDSNPAILPSDISKEVYDFIKNDARPWPHKNAIFLDDKILIVIYNQQGLDEFTKKTEEVYTLYHTR